MNKEILKKAAAAYRAIRQRCEQKTSVGYPFYGAKGIRVEFEKEEFVVWYCEKLSQWDRPLRLASVGRIDHSKNYSMNNIEVQSRADNVREMHSRNPHTIYSNLRSGTDATKRRVLILDAKTLSPICIAESLTQAAIVVGVSVQQVCLNCKENKRTLDKGRFKAEYC